MRRRGQKTNVQYSIPASCKYDHGYSSFHQATFWKETFMTVHMFANLYCIKTRWRIVTPGNFVPNSHTRTHMPKTKMPPANCINWNHTCNHWLDLFVHQLSAIVLRCLPFYSVTIACTTNGPQRNIGFEKTQGFSFTSSNMLLGLFQYGILLGLIKQSTIDQMYYWRLVDYIVGLDFAYTDHWLDEHIDRANDHQLFCGICLFLDNQLTNCFAYNSLASWFLLELQKLSFQGDPRDIYTRQASKHAL